METQQQLPEPRSHPTLWTVGELFELDASYFLQQLHGMLQEDRRAD